MELLETMTRTINAGIHDKIQVEKNSYGSLSQKSIHVGQIFGGIISSYS